MEARGLGIPRCLKQDLCRCSGSARGLEIFKSLYFHTTYDFVSFSILLPLVLMYLQSHGNLQRNLSLEPSFQHVQRELGPVLPFAWAPVDLNNAQLPPFVYGFLTHRSQNLWEVLLWDATEAAKFPICGGWQRAINRGSPSVNRSEQTSGLQGFM